MKVQVVEPGEVMADTVSRILKSNKDENLSENSDNEFGHKNPGNSFDVRKLRQIEQKQELLVGLTNLLYKKFEEMHPTKKYSKFEFTDISWYKKLGSA